MSEENKTSDKLFGGGNIEFIDIASLAIATALFIAQGEDNVLKAIGDIADSIKEGFGNEETEHEQQNS